MWNVLKFKRWHARAANVYIYIYINGNENKCASSLSFTTAIFGCYVTWQRLKWCLRWPTAIRAVWDSAAPEEKQHRSSCFFFQLFLTISQKRWMKSVISLNYMLIKPKMMQCYAARSLTHLLACACIMCCIICRVFNKQIIQKDLDVCLKKREVFFVCLKE